MSVTCFLHCRQVLLRPDGSGGVKLPARLLALYSTLFDDMFQEMLEDADDPAAASGEPPIVSGVAGLQLSIWGLLRRVL